MPVLDARQLDEEALGVLLGYFPVESRWASQERGRRVAYALGELAVAFALVGATVRSTAGTQGHALAGATVGMLPPPSTGEGGVPDARLRVAAAALLDSETVRARLWRVTWLLRRAAGDRSAATREVGAVGRWRFLKVPLAAAELLNFLVFLVRGRHPTLAARALGLVTLSGSAPSPFAQAGAELVGQAVLWEELNNTLHALMPILRSLRDVDVAALAALARRVLGRPDPRTDAQASGAVGEEPKEDARAGGGGPSRRGGAAQPRAVGSATCRMCGRQPVGPELHASSCGHRFCYYCARATLQRQGESRCPRCQEVTAFDSAWPD